jgi:hypothetical protein
MSSSLKLFAIETVFLEINDWMFVDHRKLRPRGLDANDSSEECIHDRPDHTSPLRHIAHVEAERPRPHDVVVSISRTPHVTFANECSSYGQPATFRLIGATGKRLPQTWRKARGDSSLIPPQPERCGLLLKTSVAAHRFTNQTRKRSNRDE